MSKRPSPDRQTTRALAAILDQLSRIETKVGQLMALDATTQASIDNLNNAVAQETTVEKSVETLLTGMAAQIAALKTGVTDPAVSAAIDAATAIVVANNAAAAAAVAANTPAST